MPWALEAVLAEVDADAIVFGGDYLYGPYPRETVALVRSLDAQVCAGTARTWRRTGSRAQLAPGDLEWLQALPLATTVDGVLYCHAAPTSNLPITTAITPDDAGRCETFAGVERHGGDRPHAPPVRPPHRRLCASSTRARSGCRTKARSRRSGRLSRTASPRSAARRSTSSARSHETRASAWPHAQDFVAENLLVAPVARRGDRDAGEPAHVRVRDRARRPSARHRRLLRRRAGERRRALVEGRRAVPCGRHAGGGRRRATRLGGRPVDPPRPAASSAARPSRSSGRACRRRTTTSTTPSSSSGSRWWRRTAASLGTVADVHSGCRQRRARSSTAAFCCRWSRTASATVDLAAARIVVAAGFAD